METIKSSRHHRHSTKVTDDGTTSYFYQRHTAIVLIITLITIFYICFIENTESREEDWEYNTKRGLIAAFAVFIAFGISQARDGPFIRPHPAIWRALLCANILYLLCLVFLLFQSPTNAHNLMKYLDPKLGKRINYDAYGHDCKIYDPEKYPNDPFHNFWLKIDGFVTAHFIGWVFKTLMMRDFWMANVVSVLFELCEYSLEHQLKNFSECWWDHWIMDFMICNLGGIVAGMFIIKWLKNKNYDWIGLTKQKTKTDKAKRIIAQFSPHSWVSFHWNFTSLKNTCVVMIVIIMYLVTEVNHFYLVYVLWFPSSHIIMLSRLQIMIFWGAVSTREIYDYMVGEASTIGQQFWVFAGSLVLECFIIGKFGKDLFQISWPQHIINGWLIGILLLAIFAIYKFQITISSVEPGSKEEERAVKRGEIDPKASMPRVEIIKSKCDSDTDSSIVTNSLKKNVRRRKL